MHNRSEVTANALELLMLNQSALGAAIEELSLWIRGRGGIETHRNILGALEMLETSNEGIENLIKLLRKQYH